MKLKAIDKLEKVIEYLFVLSIILTGNTMYSVLEEFTLKGISSYTFRLISLFISTLLLLFDLLIKREKILLKQCLLYIFIFLYFSLYFLISRINVMPAIEGLCLPFLTFFLINCLKQPEKLFIEFFYIFEKIIFFLATMSLIFYFFGGILNVIPATNTFYYNNGWPQPAQNFFNLHFINEWQTQSIFGHTFIRNVGIFMEAPGFAMPLLFALWWNLFGNFKVNKVRVFILLVTLVTTFSSKALMFSCLLLFFYLYSNSSISKRKSIWKKLRWGILPIILIIILIFFYYLLVSKINQSGGTIGSWELRLGDYYATLATWVKYPFFGAGFYNLPELYRHYKFDRYIGDSTAGIFNILAFGGAYMFLGYFYLAIKYLSKIVNTKSFQISITFFILAILLLATSSAQYSYLFLFIFSNFASISTKKFELNIGQK